MPTIQGTTLPSVDAQVNLIRRLYTSAGLEFWETGFVGAHGKGKAVGDPVEPEAISKVFREGRPPEEHLFFGSIKTRIGHP